MPTELFDDGDVLHSSEGITQGDPLAMPMYAIATIPLIKKLHCAVDDVNQVWYAHDAKSPDYDSGGSYFPHKVLNLAVLLMPPKLGWLQKESSSQLPEPHSLIRVLIEAPSDG